MKYLISGAKPSPIADCPIDSQNANRTVRTYVRST
jgi:hypothetical protein